MSHVTHPCAFHVTSPSREMSSCYTEKLTPQELFMRTADAPRYFGDRFSADEIAEFQQQSKCLAVRPPPTSLLPPLLPRACGRAAGCGRAGRAEGALLPVCAARGMPQMPACACPRLHTSWGRAPRRSFSGWTVHCKYDSTLARHCLQ